MAEEKYKSYITDLISILKEHAKKAEIEANHPEKSEEKFNGGLLMGYHNIIQFMKNQTEFFNIDQKEIGLDEIEPERDLFWYISQ